MATTLNSINPFTGKTLETYNLFTDNAVNTALDKAQEAFLEWKLLDIEDRTELLEEITALLEKNKQQYSELMSNEMGKPISQSIAEIEKCMTLCEFYDTNADDLLADEVIETEAYESFISYDPLGIILGIMPWNYPFWQVLRFAIPTLMAGNTVLLKHAANVSGCALIIEDLFKAAGFPEGCFQTLLVNHTQIETVIEDPRVKAVSLTGSEKAGRTIAAIAGKNLKKCVLELGGNNACIILKDANLETHIDTIVNARMQNTGQSCIAAKRFIVEAPIYDKFMELFTVKVEALKQGNPLDVDTQITVLARPDLADILEKQVNDSVEKGAKVITGNIKKGAYFQPTIITNSVPGMPIFDEETFGPVASITKVNDADEAYQMASNTLLGLGAMVFTEDIDDALDRISDIEDGAFFINSLVKSDVRLPFGGTKNSGYGRELSREGILEFTNKKTVYANK
ncbi:NAD-dependent succinate-semialdehyde dehydrogenase [Lacinutrix undariae]